MRIKRAAVFVFVMLFAGSLYGQAAEKVHLQFSSSDQQLVRAFDWARKQALSYAFSGDPVGLWYEAALPGREAFCMRDVSHQAVGAQALGLAPYTRNMLRHFAGAISESKDWCGYWEINRYDRPAPVDYQSESAFWYNLPANFDVLDASYRMYLWTGDIRYINDPVFDNFYDRSMHEYVKRWDLAPDRVMTRQRWLLPMTDEERRERQHASHFRRGIPGYNESDRTYVAGIDLLAAEYAAYRDYAVIERLRGDKAGSENASDQAAALKALVNSKWWNSANNSFFSALDDQHHLKGRDAAAVLYWGVAEEGAKTQAALNDLLAAAQHHSPCGVEGESHYAEIFYRYGAPKAAYSTILDLAKPGHCRQEYPEVSYSVIGVMTTGLMGINVLPSATREVETFPALTSKTAWAEIQNLPVGKNYLTVRHNGAHESVFTNQSGPALLWRAEFPGAYEQLLVNGVSILAHTERHLRTDISWVRIPVGAGDTVQVKAP